MSVTAVTFDVGNTLLTPAVSEADVFVAAAAEVAAQLDTLQVERFMPLVYERYEELYEQDDSFWADDERATAIWLEMYGYLCELVGLGDYASRIAPMVHKVFFRSDYWRPFDDVMPVLDELKQRGIRMGLISNWDNSLADIISGTGLSGYFGSVLSSSVVRMHKPQPGIFHLALAELGALPAETVHVGDHLQADVGGALASGIRPVLIDRDHKHTNSNAPTIITDLRQLLELI
ncbi:MAG: HAD family hydrolase [Coriobacteriales bacterium]|nr:HAD family hydrolase [Coriobacteriales bacterium]